MSKNQTIVIENSNPTSITAYMTAARQEAEQKENDLVVKYDQLGHSDAGIRAHIDIVFGEKEATPSPTPKYNPNFQF